MYTYKTKGVCSRKIDIDLEGEIIKHVNFEGGCNGNLKAISQVVEGMSISQVANLWEGNTCGSRQTSCVDQLVKALKEAHAATS